MRRRDVGAGGKPAPKPKRRRTVYVQTRGGKVINSSGSGRKPVAPRVAKRPVAGVRLKGEVRTVRRNPRTAADSNPTPRNTRVGNRNARGFGFEPRKGVQRLNKLVAASAPPGFQSPGRPVVRLGGKRKPPASRVVTVGRGDYVKTRGGRVLNAGKLKLSLAPRVARKPGRISAGARQQVAGFSPETTRAALAVANLAWVVPASTAVTVYHQPGRTAEDTAKSVVGIPAGLIRAGLNPGQSASGIVADYKRRYAAAARGDYKAFHTRQLKEGAVPEAFDIAGVVSAGGATTGRVLQVAAKGGRLGSRAERLATRTTRLRVSGGDRGVRVRKPSKNFYKNAAAAARHDVRARVQARRAARPQAAGIVREATNTPTLKAVARHNRKAARKGRAPVPKKTVRLLTDEVTPVRLRKADRAQRRMVAQRGGVTLQRMKAEQQREVLGPSGVRGSLRGLSKEEQAAFKYQVQYAPKSAADARRILIRHRDRIRRERARNPVRPVVDELPVIERLIKDPAAGFTPRVREAARVEGNRSRRLAAGDPGVNVDQALRRSHMPLGELLGVARVEGESAVQYARRVRQAGRREGLGTPSYFRSEEIPTGTRAMYAKGGSRAIQGPGVYSGALTRTGRESGDLAIVERSAAQNIKRKFNWNLVADTVDEHVLPWSRSKRFNAYQLQKEILRRGIDPESVRLWNPRLMREARQGATAAEHGVDAADPAFSSAHIHSALQHATASLDDLATNQAQFRAAGWQVAPRRAVEEVMDTATAGRAEGAVARGYDISKGQVSRVLLASPAWLGFQVASNTLMTGLAGVGPADLARSMRFFSKLDKAQRADMEALFGVHGWYKEQRRMGAAGGRWTRTWEAVKDTPFYRRGLEGKSPLDALFFRPDNAQNNMFRRALMYNRVKRETYRRLGQDASAIVRLQQRVTGMLKGGPEEQMLAVARNPRVIEELAQHVDDFLGNWTRYTAKERHVFSRFVMFYGFLRFATRLAFYTMPVNHPIMSSILLQLGRLEKDEITRIFGTNPPPWEYGNLYGPFTGFGGTPSRADANRRVPTVRLVPFFNALQYAESPGSVIGMLNPVVGTVVNQIAGKNVPLDSPYTVRGKSAYVMHSGDLSAGDRLRLAVAELLHLSPAERAVEAAVLRGKQTSDSSLLFPQPVRYKGASGGGGPTFPGFTTSGGGAQRKPSKQTLEAAARNRALIAQQNARGPARLAGDVLFPFLGTDGRRRIDSARRWNQRGQKKPAKRKTFPGFDGAGSGPQKFPGFDGN